MGWYCVGVGGEVACEREEVMIVLVRIGYMAWVATGVLGFVKLRIDQL